MSFSTYKLLHMMALMMLFLALGAGFFLGKNPEAKKHPLFVPTMASHGVALLILLVSGFGMLARLGILGDLPSWVWLKGVVWILFGGLLVLIRRLPNQGRILWLLALVLGCVAAFLGHNKDL